VTSVGSRGDSFDNALAETLIGLYKTELIRRRGPWKGIDQVEYATLEWVDWFNHRRLLEPIGHVPPAEFEAAYYQRGGPQPHYRTQGPEPPVNPGPVQLVVRP
jgi:transposase InsO family protein